MTDENQIGNIMWGKMSTNNIKQTQRFAQYFNLLRKNDIVK